MSTIKCPHCGKELQERTITLFGHGHPIGYELCDCEAARAEQEQEEREERERYEREQREKLERRVNAAEIPVHFRGTDYPDAVAYADKVMDGSWLYIQGSVGTGKSELSCAIGIELIARGVLGVKFLAMIDLGPMIRSTYGDRERSEDAIFDKYAKSKVLIIDDLGKGEMKPYEVNLVFRIIDYRYRNDLPTIINGQYNRPGLRKRLSEHGDDRTALDIISRMKEMCVTIMLSGGDRRLGGAA